MVTLTKNKTQVDSLRYMMLITKVNVNTEDAIAIKNQPQHSSRWR